MAALCVSAACTAGGAPASAPTTIQQTSTLPPTTATGRLPAAVPASDGPFAVVTENLILVDTSRGTAADHSAPSHPDRDLLTRVYLPSVGGHPAVQNGPFPVFVWAHGLAATVDYFDALLRAWAARGYVVVAPTFPLTRAVAPGGPVFADYVNQPADVSFVLGQILNRDGPDGTEHRGLIDPNRIAAGGHSLGAVTTLGLVADACCLDPRIRAAVEIDGAMLPFPHGGTIQRSVPTFLIHGDADTTFPVAGSRAMYSAGPPPKYLMVLHDIPHTGFDKPRARQVILSTVVDFLDLYLKDRQGARSQLMLDGTVPGFAVMSSSA